MSRSRITLYVLIMLLCLVIAYYNLADEPHPEWPINVIHLLFRH